MDQREQLSALIGRIYDAALDSTLWTDVLMGITEFVGGQTAGLSSIPLSRVGIDSRSVQSYLEAYAHVDLPSTSPLFDVEEIVNKTALVPGDELLPRDFGQGPAEPHELLQQQSHRGPRLGHHLGAARQSRRARGLDGTGQ